MFEISAFKIKLEAATQMRSVSEQDKRPNCLIIDEIDGAPAPTIQVRMKRLSSLAVVFRRVWSRYHKDMKKR